MILLTGGTGAIGKGIVKELNGSGQQVILVTRNKFNVKGIGNQSVIVEEGNILDTQFLTQIFKKYKIETVIHCAWDGVSGVSRNSPEQVNNFIAFKNILELAGAHQVKTFVGLGSQAEYGVYNCKITEDFLPHPDTLYGVYKLSSGLLGKVLAQQYGFRFAWLRLFAAYGPNDVDQFIIPYTINCLLKDTVPNLSTCEQSWDYLFLPDIASIIKNIIITPQHFNDIYNLSSGKATKLKEIILTIRSIMNSSISPDFGAVSKNSNLLFLEGSNEKLKEAFKITELTDIYKGLSLTIDWYKQQRGILN